jgi:signal transduction histidine kinase
MMTVLPSLSPSTRRSLLIVEICVLFVSTWFNLNDPELRKSGSNIINIVLSIIAIAPLIAVLPVNLPLWQRRVYFAISTIIFAVVNHLKVPIYTLNLVFLLKGCLLLPRREVIAIAAISMALDVASFSLRAPEIFESIRQRDLDDYLNVPRQIANIVMGDLSNCVFVLLLGNVWVEEQKSRQKAERLTKQVETLATDLERNRIARDIHDTLGHSLTSLDVQIELAQRVQATEPARAQEAIDLAKKLSSQALDNVRQALGTMKRSNFDLTEAIYALAEQSYPFQIIVDVRFPPLSLQSSYQLYCIIQESITNIQKHSQAAQVKIDSRIVDRGTILEICDNGNGFDLDRPHTGFGLRNMKERVQCLGGEFHLNSNIGGGTQIKVFVPS